MQGTMAIIDGERYASFIKEVLEKVTCWPSRRGGENESFGTSHRNNGRCFIKRAATACGPGGIRLTHSLFRNGTKRPRIWASASRCTSRAPLQDQPAPEPEPEPEPIEFRKSRLSKHGNAVVFGIRSKAVAQQGREARMRGGGRGAAVRRDQVVTFIGGARTLGAEEALVKIFRHYSIDRGRHCLGDESTLTKHQFYRVLRDCQLTGKGGFTHAQVEILLLNAMCLEGRRVPGGKLKLSFGMFLEALYLVAQTRRPEHPAAVEHFLLQDLLPGAVQHSCDPLCGATLAPHPFILADAHLQSLAVLREREKPGRERPAVAGVQTSPPPHLQGGQRADTELKMMVREFKNEVRREQAMMYSSKNSTESSSFLRAEEKPKRGREAAILRESADAVSQRVLEAADAVVDQAYPESNKVSTRATRSRLSVEAQARLARKPVLEPWDQHDPDAALSPSSSTSPLSPTPPPPPTSALFPVAPLPPPPARLPREVLPSMLHRSPPLLPVKDRIGSLPTKMNSPSVLSAQLQGVPQPLARASFASSQHRSSNGNPESLSSGSLGKPMRSPGRKQPRVRRSPSGRDKMHQYAANRNRPGGVEAGATYPPYQWRNWQEDLDAGWRASGAIGRHDSEHPEYDADHSRVSLHQVGMTRLPSRGAMPNFMVRSTSVPPDFGYTQALPHRSFLPEPRSPTVASFQCSLMRNTHAPGRSAGVSVAPDAPHIQSIRQPGAERRRKLLRDLGVSHLVSAKPLGPWSDD